MPLTFIPMIVNVITCASVWASNLTFSTKLVFTLVIILKYVFYFCSALIVETGVIRHVGLTLCALLNLSLLIYSIAIKQYTIMVGIIVSLILLIIWSLPAVFYLRKKEGNEQ